MALQGGLLGASALVLWGSVDSNEIDEPALNDWWTNEHLPERLSIPGFLRARRYYSRQNDRDITDYLTLYETADLTVLTSAAYMQKLNNPTQGTQQHIPTLATMSRSACSVELSLRRSELHTCSATMGVTMAMVVFSTTSDSNQAQHVCDSARHAFDSVVTQNKSLMAVHLLREDAAATEPGSASQSYANVKLKRNASIGVSKWICLWEFSSPNHSPFLNAHAALKDYKDEVSLSVLESAAIGVRTYSILCSANDWM